MLYHLSSTRFAKVTLDRLAIEEPEALVTRLKELEERINHILSKYQYHLNPLCSLREVDRDNNTEWDHYWIAVHQIISRLRDGNHPLWSMDFDGHAVQIWGSDEPISHTGKMLNPTFDFNAQTQVELTSPLSSSYHSLENRVTSGNLSN